MERWTRVNVVTGKGGLAAWSGVLQRGVRILVHDGDTVGDVYRDRLGVMPAMAARITGVFLDGHPVDDIESARVRDGMTLALGACMPGLVGTILRSNSPFKVMREDITCQAGEAGTGAKVSITLKLFNLLVAELGPEALARGVLMTREELAGVAPDVAVPLEGRPGEPYVLVRVAENVERIAPPCHQRAVLPAGAASGRNAVFVSMQMRSSAMADAPDRMMMLDTLGALAMRAGLEIMSVRARGFKVEEKADHSPLTEADMASHRVIAAGLGEAFPDIPVISEEGAGVDLEVRRSWDRFFLVDPLDGTKEFVKDNGEFCVCIAYLEGIHPVVGAVYAPTQRALYVGGAGLGAYRSVESGLPERLRVRADDGGGLTVVASRSHPDPRLEELLSGLEIRERITAGSALKMCMVAEGRADFYPRLNPTMEWDTAAGQAVVEGAGGVFKDLDGARFRYNKTSLKNSGFCTGTEYALRRAEWPPAKPAQSMQSHCEKSCVRVKKTVDIQFEAIIMQWHLGLLLAFAMFVMIMGGAQILAG